KNEDTVLLSNRSSLVLREFLKVGNFQCVLHFVKEVRESATIDHVFSTKYEVGQRRVADWPGFQDLGEVESKQRVGIQIELVMRVVEQPPVFLPMAPSLEPLAQAQVST